MKHSTARRSFALAASTAPLAVLLLFLLLPAPVAAQNWGWIAGSVVEDATGDPIAGATVLVHGTNFGTSADENGRFRIRLPAGRFLIQCSFVGFTTAADSASVSREATTALDFRLVQSTIEMEGVTVEDEADRVEVGVYEIEPKDIQRIPGPFRDALRALKVVPGVASNNELSYQYSVRGGGFNENLIFVDGFEVFLPFRPRQGEQEGLSLLNPEMAERVTLYTGGFPARYGGKLSSALEVTYHKPTDEPLRGAAYLSMLDGGVRASSSLLDNKVGWIASVRKAQARRFFQTQDLKGNYQPDFTDVQAAVSLRPTSTVTVDLLGIVADHEFRLDPNSRRTFFGTLSQDTEIAPSNLKSLFIQFDDDNLQVDGYRTRFFGGAIKNRWTDRLSTRHDVSYYDTRETESIRLSGTAILFLVDPGSGDPDTGEGLFETGTSRQEDFAENEVEVATLTGQTRWTYAHDSHVFEAGGYVRALEFTDTIDEKTKTIGPGLDGTTIDIITDSLFDAASLTTSQVGFYVQDDWDLDPSQPGKVQLSGGLRADYYDLTGELTVSPRIAGRYAYSDELSFLGSAGIYYQSPTYRELRGKPEVGESILGAINRDLKSQRSVQVVAGVEYFFPKRRFTLRTEAYYKDLTNVISYDVENVRVKYSGENDASGRTLGLDAQLRGEFVPGLESWVNYSFLHSREDFLPGFEDEYTTGSIPRPTDQRHTISVFVQDYIPNDPRWRVHMRTLYGSGLPYTPPVPGDRIGQILIQAPGDRHSARYPRYFRFDMGATFEMPLTSSTSRPIELQLTGEILNLFNMINTVSYYWVPASDGIWNRVPSRLTPRTINIRLRVEF